MAGEVVLLHSGGRVCGFRVEEARELTDESVSLCEVSDVNAKYRVGRAHLFEDFL